MLTISLRTPIQIEIKPTPEDSQRARTLEQQLLDREFVEPRVNGLTRAQLIERILHMNLGATAAFLNDFDIESLWAYYQHLVEAAQPRGRLARRIRQPGIRGICWSDRRF